MTMRNRDTGATGVFFGEGDFQLGLSKREAAAIAIRAGMEASEYGVRVTVPISDKPEDGERLLTPAEYAVREADALFDELEKGDG